MAIPLTRRSFFLNSDDSIDLRATSSHGLSVREKILDIDNYEMNTGTRHPFAANRTESGLETRGASVPLTAYGFDSWMAEISVGTPPKTLNVQIDTGAADIWILQAGCVGISGDRELWDPRLSESAKYQGKSFQLRYEDGTIVEGDLYADIVTISGFTANPQGFGSATSYASPMLPDNGYADGLLGLAFPSITELPIYPLIPSLFMQRRLVNQKFSLKLSSPGAELYVGGANGMLYNGEIAYTRVTNPGFWQVSMDDLRVNGDIIFTNVPVMFDTGANLIFGDWERISKLYTRIGGTLVEHKGIDFYHLPCDSFPTVTLTFGGRSFEIPPEVLRFRPIEEGSPNCFSAIVGERTPSDAFWGIGMPFLQGVYSVFDYGTSQVGFAKLA